MRAPRIVVLFAGAAVFGVSACAAFLSDFTVGEGPVSADGGGAGDTGTFVDASGDATTNAREGAAIEDSPADDGAAGFLKDSDTVVGDDGAAINAAPGDASVSDAGCLSWALGGIGVPAGTVATANSTYDNYVAARAIDGVLSTKWLADGYTGVLTLRFPSSQTITGIRMAAFASPAARETYTVTNGNNTYFGSGTKSVEDAITIESAILTPGSLNEIKISVDGGASWVAINEVSLLTSACP